MVDLGNFFVKPAVISGIEAQSQFQPRFTKGEIMNPRRDGLELPSTNAPEHVGQKNHALKLAGAVLFLTLIMFGAVHWPQSDSNAARPTASQSDGTAEPASVSDYFPAQFRAPATI